MAEKVPASLKGNKLRRLVAEERRLLLEKSALEEMLKNVQALRTKLKVEQIQLGSNLQAELGESYVEVPLQALPVPEPVNMEQEERNIAVNKPTLDLGVNNFQNMFYDDIEEDDDDSDGAGCVQEVDAGENEIDFDDF